MPVEETKQEEFSSRQSQRLQNTIENKANPESKTSFSTNSLVYYKPRIFENSCPRIL
jgi:hypothetical protein